MHRRINKQRLAHFPSHSPGGHKHDGLKLKDRVFNCPICGHAEGRDLHAAINLANAPDDKCSRVGSPRT